LAFQRTCHEPAIAGHVGYTADDPIRFAILAARYAVTFTGMKEPVQAEACVPIQNLPTTGGLVT
jgi:hypothetical protein